MQNKNKISLLIMYFLFSTLLYGYNKEATYKDYLYQDVILKNKELKYFRMPDNSSTIGVKDIDYTKMNPVVMADFFRKKFIETINKYRKVNGLADLKEDYVLSQTIFDHHMYLMNNQKDFNKGFIENNVGSKYFFGKTLKDRLLKRGYNKSIAKNGIKILDNSLYSVEQLDFIDSITEPNLLVNRMLKNAKYRFLVINPFLTKYGFGFTDKVENINFMHNFLFGYGSDNLNFNWYSVYPYNGQSLSFLQYEDLAFGIEASQKKDYYSKEQLEYVGYPISISFHYLTKHILKDFKVVNKNTNQNVSGKLFTINSNSIFIPKEELEKGVYEATIFGDLYLPDKEEKTIIKTSWNFTIK
jgi:hypothetical protein